MRHTDPKAWAIYEAMGEAVGNEPHAGEKFDLVGQMRREGSTVVELDQARVAAGWESWPGFGLIGVWQKTPFRGVPPPPRPGNEADRRTSR